MACWVDGEASRISFSKSAAPSVLMRASLASYARYWREAFRLPTMDHEAVGRELFVHDVDRVWAALEEGRYRSREAR